jgi:DmX-like protein
LANLLKAYTSGGNIVILSSNFDRVQIISEPTHDQTTVRCVECTLDTGKIAAAFGSTVKIFEPTPSAKKNLSVIASN